MSLILIFFIMSTIIWWRDFAGETLASSQWDLFHPSVSAHSVLQPILQTVVCASYDSKGIKEVGSHEGILGLWALILSSKDIFEQSGPATSIVSIPCSQSFSRPMSKLHPDQGRSSHWMNGNFGICFAIIASCRHNMLSECGPFSGYVWPPTINHWCLMLHVM